MKSSSIPSIRVRAATDPEHLKAIFRLRYETYVLEQRKSYAEVDHEERQFSDALDRTGIIFFAQAGNKVIGTVRLNSFNESCTIAEHGSDQRISDFVSRWKLAEIVTCTRLVVDGRKRGSVVSRLLMEACYKYAIENGVRFCLISCVPTFVSFFEHYGFRPFLSPVFKPAVGKLERMALVLDDVVQFQRVKSPFLPLVLDPCKGSESKAWFEHMFGGLPWNQETGPRWD